MQLFEANAKQSPIAVARDTIAKEGIRGIFRGLPALIYFSVPKVSSRMFGYEMLKNVLQDDNGKMSASKTALAGMGAGVLEAIVAVTPQDTIKPKLIHDQLTRAPADRKYRGFFHGVRTIVAEQGLSGVYKGLTSTVMKQASNQAIRWLVYGKTKDFMAGPGGDPKALHAGYTVVASIITGAASVFGNTPIDVIKTRMQGLESARYTNTLDCGIQIMKNEGIAGFYKGALARLARVCLDVTVIMVLYEEINRILDKAWPTD